MEEDGYPSISDSMLSSINVLDSDKLKEIKMNKEDDLLNRALNYINYCGTHKFSKYCHLVSLRNLYAIRKSIKMLRKKISLVNIVICLLELK